MEKLQSSSANSPVAVQQENRAELAPCSQIDAGAWSKPNTPQNFAIETQAEKVSLAGQAQEVESKTIATG